MDEPPEGELCTELTITTEHVDDDGVAAGSVLTFPWSPDPSAGAFGPEYTLLALDAGSVLDVSASSSSSRSNDMISCLN